SGISDSPRAIIGVTEAATSCSLRVVARPEARRRTPCQPTSSLTSTSTTSPVWRSTAGWCRPPSRSTAGAAAGAGARTGSRGGDGEDNAAGVVGYPARAARPPLVRLAGVQAAAGHAPQGVQVQPGDRGGRVGGGRYFVSNIRWISVSAQAIGA